VNFLSLLGRGGVKRVEFLGDISGSHSTLRVMLTNGLRLLCEDVHAMLLHLFGLSSAGGTAKDVLVLLLGEVDIVVSVRVGELGRVESVILVERIRAEGVTVFPSLELEVGDGAAAVEVRNLHSSAVSLVIDGLSSSEPLLLLTKSFKDVIGADLHDGELLVLAYGVNLAVGGLAGLELADLSEAASGDLARHESHELGVLHNGRAVTTLSSSEGSSLAIGDPIVMGLILLMVLLERVIQGTVQPVELRNRAQVEGHLSVFIGGVVVSGTDGVHLLVDIGVNDVVAPVVMGLLPIVLGEVRRVEVNS